MNIVHDLNKKDYEFFVNEQGVFNDRFDLFECDVLNDDEGNLEFEVDAWLPLLSNITNLERVTKSKNSSLKHLLCNEDIVIA